APAARSGRPAAAAASRASAAIGDGAPRRSPPRPRVLAHPRCNPQLKSSMIATRALSMAGNEESTTGMATAPEGSDRLTRFLLDRAGVRGVRVHLGDSWRQVRARGDYPPAVSEMLGEATAAAALFTGHVKV